MRPSYLTVLLALLALVGSVSACGQCGTIRISLSCPISDYSCPVDGSGGLICDVVKNEVVNFTCQVDSLHSGSVIKYKYAWYDMSQNSSYPFNGQKIAAINVTADNKIYCVAVVADIQGTWHGLASNNLTLKVQSNSENVTEITSAVTIGNKTHHTQLKCTDPGWYPAPEYMWRKDGEPLTPEMEPNMVIVTKAFGAFKKGSLVLHGVSQNLSGVYTCHLLYKERTKLTMEEKPSETLATNQTVTVTGSVASSTTSFETSGIEGATHPEYVTPGTPVLFNCQGIGGNTTDGATRLVINWYRYGSEYGLKIKNTSNTNCETNKEDPTCWMMSTNSTKDEVKLTEANIEMYSVKIHPLGHWLVLEADYSEVDSEYRCRVSLTNTSTATAVKFTQPTMLGGLGVETGSICGYSKTDVTLPLSGGFNTTYTGNLQKYLSLPGYTVFEVYKNQTGVTPKTNKINELVVTLADPAQDASNCQYYQVIRSIKDVSKVVKTVLVENLGAKGSNTYDASSYSAPKINISVTTDSDTSLVVECMATGDESVAEWITMCPKDIYTLSETPVNSTCDWNATITFDKAKMSEACKAECRAKSQCTSVTGKMYMAMPSRCSVPSVANAKFLTKEGDMSGKSIYANDKVMPVCAKDFQLEGPSVITCEQSGKLSSSATSCEDMSNVKCTNLNAGNGSLSCDVSGSTTCLYKCQDNSYFEDSGALKSKMTVTCAEATATWSHMSSNNPMGDLPVCAETKNPSGILTTAVIDVAGSGTCLGDAAYKAAVITTLTASNEAAYNCMDNGKCEVSSVTCKVKASNQLTLTIVINQTADTSDDSISTAFGIFLKGEAEAKTFTISVGSKKRAATTLKATGTVTITAGSTCPTGSGSVGTKCIVCAAGSFANKGKCELCPMNEYSAAAEQTSCTKCPSGLKTFAKGQDSETDCTSNICTIATISNGFTSPTSGWTVASDTMVTTYCNSGYSVGFKNMITKDCVSVARCSKMCLVSEISDSSLKFTDTSIVVGSKIDDGGSATIVCDSATQKGMVCSNGAKLEYECGEGLGIALIAGLCVVALVVLIAVVMSAVVINKRNKKPKKVPAPVPMVPVVQPVYVEPVKLEEEPYPPGPIYDSPKPEPYIYTRTPEPENGLPSPSGSPDSIIGVLTKKISNIGDIFD